MIKTRLIETEEGFYVIEVAVCSYTGLCHVYFLVDTGTSNSIFAADVADYIKDDSLIEELGDTISTKTGMASLIIQNVRINMRGHFVERETLPSIKGYDIHGILGSDFFLANNMVLDFSTNELYQHQFRNNETKRMDYYSMKLGLDSYRVPMIVLEGNGICFFFILDSGSNYNVISSCSLKCIQESIKVNTGTFYIQSLGTRSWGTEYTVPFKIHSFAGEKSVIERFVCPYNRLSIIKSQHTLFDINGIIGTAFLRKHKVVLDYHQKIFYSMAV